MIKTVFFDLDGVLTLDGDACPAICKALSQQYELPYETLQPVVHRYMSTMLLEPVRYESIIDSLNKDLGGTAITVPDIYKAIVTVAPNTEMIALAGRLREAGYGTGIITDNNVERMEQLYPVYHLEDFTPLIVSASAGHSKWQDDTIFTIALNEAGVTPDEAVFIDNTKSNLDAATTLGIHTYWHDHDANKVSDFEDMLRKLGVSS